VNRQRVLDSAISKGLARQVLPRKCLSLGRGIGRNCFASALRCACAGATVLEMSVEELGFK